MEKKPCLFNYKSVSDSRGEFLSFFKEDSLQLNKIWGNRNIKQVNMSINKKIGTVRGMHFQKEPFQEAKIVNCIKGKVYDILVDIRKDSSTYLKIFDFNLSASERNSLFVPEGYAHGFQVLEEDTQLLYLHSENWNSAHDSGIRWSDPKLSIRWPLTVTEISIRDQTHPLILS